MRPDKLLSIVILYRRAFSGDSFTDLMTVRSVPISNHEAARFSFPYDLAGRYAIYFAPRADSQLWSLACLWLGWDAAAGRHMQPPAFNGLSRHRWRAVTEDASRYGFHATLKAPFYLADGMGLAELDIALLAFSQDRDCITLPNLAIDDLGSFIAMQLATPSNALQSFASECVRAFDAFRKPLSAAERARREPSKLTPGQRALLQEWGYPYVFDEWRFHMTLSCRLEHSERTRIRALLQQFFHPALAQPPVMDAICLFHQYPGDTRFRILRRYPFREAA